MEIIAYRNQGELGVNNTYLLQKDAIVETGANNTENAGSSFG